MTATSFAWIDEVEIKMEIISRCPTMHVDGNWTNFGGMCTCCSSLSCSWDTFDKMISEVGRTGGRRAVQQECVATKPWPTVERQRQIYVWFVVHYLVALARTTFFSHLFWPTLPFIGFTRSKACCRLPSVWMNVKLISECQTNTWIARNARDS